jgi:hypothetical protein
MFSNKHFSLSTLTIILLLLNACVSKPVVFSDFDSRHDFTTDKTVSWVQNPPMLRSGDYPVSSIAEMRMTEAIKNEFITKGYEFVEDTEMSDLSVTYTMGAREKIEIVEYDGPYYKHYSDWGWGAYYFPYFVHFELDRRNRLYAERLPRSYTDGTIAIDIFDTKTKQPVWHTKASKRLSSKDLNSHLINATNVAKKLLADFPLVRCEPMITDQCRPFKSE